MIKYLGKVVEVKIDRPLGSKHPEYQFYYPLNYGYIENTVSGDREEIDVYILGEFEPLETYKGVVIGIIKRLDGEEDKLVVANKLNSYEKSQIRSLTEFQERFFNSEIITYDYLRQSIRNTVRAVIKRGHEILVLEEVKDSLKHYYLPGGGIEFLETSEAALRREIKEELNLEIKNCKELCTLSNIFEVNGMKSHELTQIFEIKVDEVVNDMDNVIMTGDLIPSTLKWINIDEFKSGDKIFYPRELLRYI